MVESTMEKREDSHEELFRKDFSGIILPYLTYLYSLIFENIVKKYELKVNAEFWMFLTLGIFSSILYATGVSKWVPVTFFLSAISIFTLYNSSYIRRKWFPKQNEKIDAFLRELGNKNLSQILRGLREYNFTTAQLIQILKTEKGQNYKLYKFILRYQGARTEIISYVLSRKLYKNIDDSLLCKYLLKNKNPLPLKDYLAFSRLFAKNKRVIGALIVSNPGYLRSHNVLKFFLKIRENIRDFFHYGVGPYLLLVTSFFLTFFAIREEIARDFNTNPRVDYLLVYILGFLMTSLFVALFLRIIFDLIMGLYTKVLSILCSSFIKKAAAHER